MISQALKQVATYWAMTGYNDYGGAVFALPVQIPCRWENKIELFRNKEGKEVASKGKVYFLQPVELDGYLWLGTSTEADPRTVPDSYEIQGLYTTPDLRNLKSLTVAYL